MKGHLSTHFFCVVFNENKNIIWLQYLKFLISKDPQDINESRKKLTRILSIANKQTVKIVDFFFRKNVFSSILLEIFFQDFVFLSGSLMALESKM